MTSNVEQAKSDIIREFEVVSVANGYRTTPSQVIGAIRHPNDIQNLAVNSPEIGVEFGVEQLKPMDQAWTTFESLVFVMVACAFKVNTDLGNEAVNLETEAEKIRHDLKRVVATIMKKYIVGATAPWNVSPNTKSIEFGAITGEGFKRNVASVGCSFEIQLRHQDGTFST